MEGRHWALSLRYQGSWCETGFSALLSTFLCVNLESLSPGWLQGRIHPQHVRKRTVTQQGYQVMGLNGGGQSSTPSSWLL